MRNVDGLLLGNFISDSILNQNKIMKKKENVPTIRSSAAEYLTFIAATGDSKQSFEIRYEDENIWLTQKMLATLYDVEIHTINEHIKKVFSDNELPELEFD